MKKTDGKKCSCGMALVKGKCAKCSGMMPSVGKIVGGNTSSAVSKIIGNNGSGAKGTVGKSIKKK